MRARLHKPARTAMSSGVARTRHWVLEFEPASKARIDPLMGWTSSDDTQRQVSLHFDTREDALSYALDHEIEVIAVDPNRRSPNIRPGGYGENFASGRRGAWTH